MGKKEEIEIKEDDYELIPMSPIRRLEKRLERIENLSIPESGTVFKDVLEIVRMNQLIVDELAKSNDALRIEISKLPAKIDELVMNLKELINFIKAAGHQEEREISKEAMAPLLAKLDELVKTNKEASEKNDAMLELLDTMSKRLKPPRPPVMLPGTRSTPLQTRPIQRQVKKPLI